MRPAVRSLGVMTLLLACGESLRPAGSPPEPSTSRAAPVELQEMEVQHRFGLGYVIEEPSASSDADVHSPHPVSIQAGLVPRLEAKDVVPARLPHEVGMGRVTATIESIERVALVTGDNIPGVHSSLGARSPDLLVWVVLFRGRFRANMPGYSVSDGTTTRGFYTVSDASGSWSSLGGLPQDPGLPQGSRPRRGPR